MLFPSMRMKRKDVEEVNDDFSDFSLSSPATKIRRLDAELAPIMEEEEREINQERAIVLFNPHQQLHAQSPSSSFSVSLSPDIMSGMKNQVLGLNAARRQSDPLLESDEEEEAQGRDKAEKGICMAMVPWTSSNSRYLGLQHPMNGSNDAGQLEAQGFTENEAAMEIDEENSNNNGGNDGSFQPYGFGLSQWQQQHCMLPQLPHNAITPITWLQ